MKLVPPLPDRCPGCGAAQPDGARFCESCGRRAPGEGPPPEPPPVSSPMEAEVVRRVPPVERHGPPPWVAEIWVDAEWHADQDSEEGSSDRPPTGAPRVVGLWDRRVLVGRASRSRGIEPAVDCGADAGVSRRHALLTTDGRRWWVEDLGSANGTWVSPGGDGLAVVSGGTGAGRYEAVPAGERHLLDPGGAVYVGAWTRIVVRTPTAAERLVGSLR